MKHNAVAKPPLVGSRRVCFDRAMKCFNFVRATALMVLLLVSLIGCITNPETGRRQLLLVPESEMTALGLSSFEQMKKETPISKDPAANALVQRVGKRIASVVNLPGAQWEFVVFESKEANAFCLPGGKIGVYTGILRSEERRVGKEC